MLQNTAQMKMIQTDYEKDIIDWSNNMETRSYFSLTLNYLEYEDRLDGPK